MTSDCEGIQKLLNSHIEIIKVLKENDFRTIGNTHESLERLFQAALSLLSEPPFKPKRKMKPWKNWFSLHQHANEKVEYWHDAIGHILGCQEVIIKALAKAGLDGQFEEALIRELQKPPATPYTKELVLKFHGDTHRAVVEYTPAACIRLPAPEGTAEDISLETIESDSTQEFDPYENAYQGKFCPSMKRDEDEHCVNLMTVEMTMDNEPVYDEIRVGIPHAFAVDESSRQRVTDLRWREVITTAAIQKHMPAVQQAMLNPGNHEPIEVPISYNCLLSPDLFRRFSHINDNENTWAHETIKLVNEINNGPHLTLRMRDSSGSYHSIKVKPTIFMSVTPCNELSYDSIIPNLGTWYIADKLTKQTLTSLFGSLDPDSEITGYVGRHLGRLSKDSPEFNETMELSELIRKLFKQKDHHKLMQEPMYFSDLLTELGRVMNMANVIGCKSAKDRTGNKSQSDMKMAAECHLARKRHRDKKTLRIVPPPVRHITEDDHFNACQLTLNSGQTENQKKSTAVPGYKMRDYMLGSAITVFKAVNRRVKTLTSWLKVD